MSWRNTREPSVVRQQVVVLTLIAMMAIFLGLQALVTPLLELSFMMFPAQVVKSWENLRAGEFGAGDLHAFSTMLTSTLLHGGVDHFANNMVFYWIFGALINKLVGWRWLLLIVCVTALGGSITHVAMNPEKMVPVLGASGVVSGFMGAYLGMAFRWQLPDPQIWPIAHPVPPANLALLAVVFVAIDYFSIFSGSKEMIAFGAHVGGFTAGLFFSSLAIPKPAQATLRR